MAQTSSTHTLSDGRKLGYMDYASSDLLASAPTLLYFHGFPGSRLEGSLAIPRLEAHGARLVSIDRPGMGLSTFQSNRTFANWPKDVLELVDHLNINKFYILGVSGGSPYVISCAHLLPRDRLLGAAIVSGVYPFTLGTEGMPMATKILMQTSASDWLRPAVALLVDWYMGKTARDYEHPEKLEQQFMKEMEGKHEKDVKCLENWELRKVAIEATREAFRKDSYGVAWEAKLYGSDWGFAFEEVTFDRIQMWHGRLDANVPVASAEKAADLLEGATLRVLEEESHLSLPVNHLDGILASLLQISSS